MWTIFRPTKPAGLYTEVSLPIAEIVENCDTINSAKITFTRYNENAGDTRTPSYAVVVACASYRGNFFTGAVGSTLYVDDFKFTYR